MRRPRTKAAQPTRSLGGRPRREESEKKIAQFLDCAAELFAREGYARTSMDALADAGGIGKPTIYAHFGSKSNLFSMVVDHILNHQLVAFESVDAKDAVVALKKQLSSVLAASLEPMFLGFFRLFLAEAHKFPEILAAFNACSEVSARLLEPHLKRVAQQTKLRAPVEEITNMLLAMISKLVIMEAVRTDSKTSVDPDNESSRIVDLVLYGVLARDPPKKG